MSFGGQEYKNPNDDIMVNNSPRETVQSISWSPNNRFLAAGGWDSKVSLYQVNSNNGQTKPVAQTKHDAPVLDTSFHDDGSGLFSSSCDKTVKFWKFQGNQSSVVAKHEKPIKGCYWNKQLRMLITGGWDKRLCYWDLRQKKLACSVNLPERLYCMDVLHPLVVCATANRRIVMYHLSKPDKVFREAESKLNFQSRVIAAFG
jgi:mRNA export factor